MFTEFKVARSYYGGAIFWNQQSLFCVLTVYTHYKKLDFYAMVDDLKKVQSYLDYNIKRSDMKGRHKRVAGITVENSAL